MDTTRKGCLLNVLLFGFGAVLGTGLTAVAGVVLFLPSSTTISTNEGSPNVYVKERSRLLGGTDHEVWLGRTEDYGHVVPIPDAWGTAPEVVRTPEGVELRFGSGEADGGSGGGGTIAGGRIFVPAEAYVGGR
ncbi:hypothetical protein [Saccharothrix xinjiangensis]|uniref:Uncharacterized protein n=1 Tax=Saccharothrix xinjiangensis TaxID=204798 RepID=A0ABV9XYI9_9PSEU